MMFGRIGRRAVGAALAGCAVAGLVAPANAENFIEHSAEVRMQLDFHVPDAALKKMLPDGWEPVIATAGPAKDANLRMIFIDRVGITGADGQPIGAKANQLVYLAVPIKQTASGTAGQMLIAGLTADPADAPGPFGVYQHASTHRMERSTLAGPGAQTLTEENWEFAAADGERMEVHLKYIRGAGRKTSAETKFFSATNPGVYQVFKIDQGLDIMRNATIDVRDRVTEFRYKASGGRIGALFDGSERVLSIDAIHWYNRAISAP
jgi:hypothetical protein